MDDAPESGKCFKCEVELGKEFYCYGCEEFVCDDCPGHWSVADAASSNKHEPEDHFVEAECDDEDE